MTKKNNLFILSVLTTVALFVYLTIHHYAIKLGLGGNAICSISQKINCDAAALSRFSEIFQIPVSLFGLSFHLLLLGLALFQRWNWMDSSLHLKKTIQLMLLLAVTTSVIMAFISFAYVKVICPFCFATYIFSVLNLILGWNLFAADSNAQFDISLYFSEYKSHIALLALIPVSSWIFSGMISEKYGLDKLNSLIPEKIALWKASPVFEFTKTLGLSNGVSNAKLSIVEFADFKCPHCKTAVETFDTFLQGRQDIEFVYMPFPLDGTCNSNPEMPKGDGTRCTLAAWSLCAEKLAGKGWEMHHWIFNKQEEISDLGNLANLLPEIEKKFQINASELTTCADSTAIYDQIKKSSAEGNKAQVNGTPTVYLNGKKLGYGHIMEVLRKATQEAL